MIYTLYVKPFGAYRTWRFIASDRTRAWIERYAATHYEGWLKEIREEPT